MAQPKPPAGLGARARKFWSATTGEYALRVDELRILEDACREMDLIDRLEADLVDAELTVSGSTGQPVANPLASEVRQHRAVLLRLFQGLKLPEDAAEDAAAGRSAQMRAVASARWASGA